MRTRRWGRTKQKGGRIAWTYKRPDHIPYNEALGPRKCHPGNKAATEDSCIPATELGGSALQFCQRHGGCKDGHVSDEAILKVVSPDIRKTWEKKYFRPKAPEVWAKDPDDWLDNHSIEAVLKQYEEADPTFMTLGAVPIDFAAPSPYSKTQQCLLPEFCKVNINDLRAKGKKGVGMVFNLDPHFKDGSHWVSMYLDVEEPACYYFDSYGYRPPKQIRQLMETFWSQDNNCKLAYNGRRFQYSESECGIYSIYFIVCMHSGAEFKKFVKHRVKDNVMLFLRSWFFNTEPLKSASQNEEAK